MARLQDGQKNERGKVDLVSFAVPYWLSVPLPIQMLGKGYVAWRRAEKTRKRRDEPTFRKTQRDHLEAPKSWPHPQFRALERYCAAVAAGAPMDRAVACLGGICRDRGPRPERTGARC